MESPPPTIVVPRTDATARATAFVPVARIATSSNVLVVNPALPVNSVAELVAYAKAHPGGLSYASPGVGTPAHLIAEWLKAKAGIDMVHVPYKGGGVSVQDVMTGQVQLTFENPATALPMIASGGVRPLAVTSETRSELAAEIPTMVESGFDGFVTASINFIVAPPGTPMPVRQQVSDAVARALASDDLKQAFAKIGATARPASPDELAVYMVQQQQRWSRIVETTKISLD